MSNYRTKEEIKMEFGKGHFQVPITIPKGTRCKLQPDYPTKTEVLFWVDDLQFLKGQMVHHDAYYYGITLREHQIESY